MLPTLILRDQDRTEKVGTPYSDNLGLGYNPNYLNCLARKHTSPDAEVVIGHAIVPYLSNPQLIPIEPAVPAI